MDSLSASTPCDSDFNSTKFGGVVIVVVAVACACVFCVIDEKENHLGMVTQKSLPRFHSLNQRFT